MLANHSGEELAYSLKNIKCSKLVGFIHAKMAMAVVRVNILLLRGTRLKQPKSIPFVDGTALDGFSGLHEL